MIVETASGRVEGGIRDGGPAFLGIPFAAPPIGPRRFRPPEPAELWTGTRPARTFGPASLQGSAFIFGAASDGTQNEDCLTLNVFTPAADAARRPVMFWIHGGAFIVGSASSPLYEGRRLCDLGDVVVVTTNYRLGALGFLHLGEPGRRMGAGTNVGLLDQIAALRWVRENIDRFGGDPGNVTLFGESAGATSVSVLQSAPAARGLFRRAVAQSSAAVPGERSAEEAARTTHSFLSTLGIPAGQPERLLDVPPNRIVEAQAKVESGATQWLGFFPVSDGGEFPLGSAGGSPDVPLILGSNRDEWNLFAAVAIAEWGEPLETDRAVSRVQRKVGCDVERARALLEAYRLSRSARSLPADNRALLRAIEGDLRFRIPMIRFAETHVGSGGRVFMYLFTHESPALRGELRACHALDLPFVFGTLDAPMQDRFAGKGPAVEALSRSMMGAWTRFARTGDPAESDEWSGYDVARRSTRIFDGVVRSDDAPFEEERRAWDGLL